MLEEMRHSVPSSKEDEAISLTFHPEVSINSSIFGWYVTLEAVVKANICSKRPPVVIVVKLLSTVTLKIISGEPTVI